MTPATKIIIAAPLLLCLGGCGSLGAWQVGAGVLGAGATFWQAQANAKSVNIQQAADQRQAKAANDQARLTEANIRLINAQVAQTREQTLHAVATREVECSNYVYAGNSFAQTICQGLNRTSVCKRVYAAAKRSPDVCAPMLRQADYRF